MCSGGLRNANWRPTFLTGVARPKNPIEGVVTGRPNHSLPFLVTLLISLGKLCIPPAAPNRHKKLGRVLVALRFGANVP
jgi:hypothetical protein